MTDKITPINHATAEGWFARMQQGTDAATLAEFNKWLEEPGNAVAYEQCCELWGLTASLADAPEIQAYMNAAPRPVERKKSWRPWLYGALSAAAAVILVVLWLPTQTESFTYYQTALGEQREIQLEDGSTATLNTDSKIGVSYQSRQRHLVLIKGEALFHVSKDKARPFIVSAGECQVTAVGTQFNVWRDGSSTNISVLEGKVSVGPDQTHGDENKPILVAGQALNYAAGGKLSAVYTADTQRIYGWTKGRLTFNAVPLSQALREYNRYTAKPIVVKDAALQTSPISGVFQTGNTAAFVAALKELLPIEAQENAEYILLRPIH